MEPKTALLLCGGKGTRLRPLTYEIPKVLLPVQGKPLLEHNIETLKRHGVINFILSVGYLKEQIKGYFGNGSKLGVKIKYLEEDEPLGTAGPLRLAKKQEILPKTTFIMANGDELKEIDIPKLYKIHKDSNAMVTIALVEVQDTRDWGVVELRDHQIVRFVEKPEPEAAPSNLANAGFYLMEPEVADLVPEGQVSLERRIFPLIAKKGRLFGVRATRQWFPTDTPEKLETARKNWNREASQSLGF